MMQLVAMGMVAWGIWSCCSCGRYFYIGKKPDSATLREFQRWKAAKRIKQAREENDHDTDAADDEPAPADAHRAKEAWYDRTIMCCCIWPLCWRGKFSSSCTGTLTSIYCRMARLFCCFFLALLVLAAMGAVAKMAADTDPTGRSIVDIWNETVTKKLAERVGRGMSPVRPPPPPFEL